jgi:hypothetical protein
MPVVLITDQERLVWEDEDTKTSLIYRRPTSAKQREIESKHTVNGLTDTNAYLEELISWSVLDWSEGFVDDRGNPIKYEDGMTAGLPETYKARYLINLYLVDPISAETGN